MDTDYPDCYEIWFQYHIVDDFFPAYPSEQHSTLKEARERAKAERAKRYRIVKSVRTLVEEG